MNAAIINKPVVKDSVLDVLAKELPVIIAEAMDVPGGNLAPLKPEQVSLDFTQASHRDVGPDIRIKIFAKKNDPRKSTLNDRAKTILERITALIGKEHEQYSINVRLYLVEIGMAEC